MNLMSIDAARVSDLVTYVDMLWSGPFQILIAIYFLSVTMGISILAGIGILVLLIPVNLLVTKLARRQQVMFETTCTTLNNLGYLQCYQTNLEEGKHSLELKKTCFG